MEEDEKRLIWANGLYLYRLLRQSTHHARLADCAQGVTPTHDIYDRCLVWNATTAWQKGAAHNLTCQATARQLIFACVSQCRSSGSLDSCCGTVAQLDKVGQGGGMNHS